MNFLQKLRSPKGFTLVELIIVIMIIGILAATLLPKVMGAPSKARDAGRQADLNAASTALEMFFADNEAYPEASLVTYPAGIVEQALVAKGYLKSVLEDAVNTNGYIYVYCAADRNGVPEMAYALYARMESHTQSLRTFVVGEAPIIDLTLASDTVLPVAGADTAVYTNSVCVVF